MSQCTFCAISNTLAMYRWSHAVMYMGNEKTVDSHPVHSIGTDWGTIHDFLYDDHYDWITFLRVENRDDESAERAGNNAEGFIGASFEYPGWGEFESTFSSDNNLYCAELVYKSWISEGTDLRLFGEIYSPFPWIRPNDIYVSFLTRVLKEIAPMPHSRP
ncbi:MAG TPA: hypothetical protein ENK58_08080 [Desulfobacterales bacterium]|nr:hypothetical protein [Desulfobacterales bacterium]